MKLSYDSQVDAAYIRFSNETPYGAIEISEGIIVHVTEQDKIVAIEILDVSQKMSIQELFKYEIENPQLLV